MHARARVCMCVCSMLKVQIFVFKDKNDKNVRIKCIGKKIDISNHNYVKKLFFY